jgi:GcrA cell cycle regulator
MFSSPRSWPTTNAAGAPSHNSTGIELSEQAIVRSKRKLWTQSEEATFSRLWTDHGQTAQGIAARLGRSPCACWKRARILDLPLRHVLPPEIKSLVVELWNEGVPSSQIGARVGIKPGSVRGLTRRLNLPPRPLTGFHKTFSPEQDALLTALWSNKTLSNTQICERVGRGKHSCQRRAKELNLGRRPDTSHNNSPWITAEAKAKLESEWKAGTSASTIARMFGVTRNSVIGRLHRAGLLRTGSRPRRERAPQMPRAPRARRESKVSFGVSSRRTAPGWSGSLTPAVLALPDPAYADCVTFEQLKHGRCHWPLGEPTKFCGRQSCEIGHGSYCEQHYARSIARRFYA